MSKVFEYYMGVPCNEDPEPTKLDYLSVTLSGGHGVTGTRHFTFNGTLTEDEAMDLQEEYGYHPAGYGFSGFKVVDDVSTWETDPGLQFPKYITCGCEFTYVGKYLPSTLGKHYELGWLKDEGWNKERMGTINRTGKVPVRSKSRTHDMSKLFESMQPLNKGN